MGTGYHCRDTSGYVRMEPDKRNRLQAALWRSTPHIMALARHPARAGHIRLANEV